LNKTVISVVTDAFKELCHVEPGAEPVVVEKEIIEYDGRMRLSPMEKFNGPACVGVVTYHLSEKDQKDNIAVGTFALFIKEDVVEKVLKALGRPKADMDNDEVVLDGIGEFCRILAENVRKGFAAEGYSSLLASEPLKYRNAVPEGVPFDYALFRKQELTFNFWNRNCVVIEACLGHVPLSRDNR
jgi:hypothetical protein